MIVKENETKQRELVPAGNHLGRCVWLIDQGTHQEMSSYADKMVDKHSVRIAWELPKIQRVYKEELGEQPAILSRQINLSFHEKSTLRLLLKTWRGREFTADELKGFDLKNILGKPCLVNVLHNEASNGKTYDNVSTVTPLMDGQTVPPQQSESIYFTFTSPDWDVFRKLPEWIQRILMESHEWGKPEIMDDRPADIGQPASNVSHDSGFSGPGHEAENLDEDDDIPF